MHFEQGIVDMKTTTNRISRGMLNKAAIFAGAALLALVTAAAPVYGQATPAATPAATTRPANALIAEGVGADGKVRLTVNKTIVLTTTKPYKQVSVGQADVADVNLINPNSILVTAKKTGSTQLIVWDDNNRSQVADIVVSIDLESLQAELSSMFPGAKITANSMNGAVSLRGQVPDLKTADQAATMAAPYSSRVMNFLEVPGGQQVMLQVRFAEVSRRATQALGVNFGFTDGTAIGGTNNSGAAPFSIVTDEHTNFLGVPQGTVGFTLFGQGVFGNTALVGFINALRQNNLLRILAEPNLVAMSGQEASFLAGGEFPVPVPQSGSGGETTITIEYREFGVRLKFIPIVLGNGKIRLKLNPEVSDLDFSSPLQIVGSRIPIVNKRNVSTTIEIADGQTFAIAGLLDNNIAASKDVTPLLGDLPVLGTLFRSTRYERRETELVVLVTPRLVEPMEPNQVPKLPGETWRHPKEADLFFNGDLGGPSATKPLAAPADTAPAAQGTPGTDSPRYRGSYGFTPPSRATTTGSNEQ
jgi:pilus assembly protein CpaC